MSFRAAPPEVTSDTFVFEDNDTFLDNINTYILARNKGITLPYRGHPERDAVRRYYIPGVPIGTTSITSNLSVASANHLRMYPFYHLERISIDQLAIIVGTAGLAASRLRIGLYRLDDQLNFVAKLAASDELDASTVGVKEFTLPAPLTLDPGLYATALTNNDLATDPIIRFHKTGSLWPGTNTNVALTTIGQWTRTNLPFEALPDTFEWVTGEISLGEFVTQPVLFHLLDAP